MGAVSPCRHQVRSEAACWDLATAAETVGNKVKDVTTEAANTRVASLQMSPTAPLIMSWSDGSSARDLHPHYGIGCC